MSAAKKTMHRRSLVLEQPRLINHAHADEEHSADRSSHRNSEVRVPSCPMTPSCMNAKGRKKSLPKVKGIDIFCSYLP